MLTGYKLCREYQFSSPAVPRRVIVSLTPQFRSATSNIWLKRSSPPVPGIPGTGGDDLFNQMFEVADLNWGVSDTITLLGTAGLENWYSLQSLYPVNMQITEFGVGADLNEDPYV